MAGREPEGPFRSLARRARCFALAFALAACTVTWSAAALAWSDPDSDSESRTRKRRAARLEAVWPCPRILAQSHRHGRAAVRPTQHIVTVASGAQDRLACYETKQTRQYRAGSLRWCHSHSQAAPFQAAVAPPARTGAPPGSSRTHALRPCSRCDWQRRHRAAPCSRRCERTMDAAGSGRGTRRAPRAAAAPWRRRTRPAVSPGADVGGSVPAQMWACLAGSVTRGAREATAAST